MYTEFYGLSRKAFSKTPDPHFLYLNEDYEEALTQLLFAVEERELCVLIGPIGAGKTLMVHTLIEKLSEDHEIGVILNPRLTPAGFLRAISTELGVEEPRWRKSDLIVQLQDRLIQLEEEEKTAVLVVDEAQLVPAKAVFDEIRLLMNFQLGDRNLITIILVGQPQLLKRLRHPAYEPLTQRVGAGFELKTFTAEETKRYMEHRLRKAGSNGRRIFDARAVAVIHQASGGIPRVINNLATQCLLEGLGREIERIDGPTAEAVVASQMFLPGAR